MANSNGWAVLLAYAAISISPTAAIAQISSVTCKPSSVVPRSADEQPPPKIIVNPPLPEVLASRGVAIIEYCAENLRFVPVFGQTAASVSPRIGHIHVSVDDASWVWADASGNPIILQGLSPGQHKVRIDLVDANHHPLDSRTISFSVPQSASPEPHR